MNYFLNKKFKRLLIFLDPSVLYYGSYTDTQEMTEDIQEIEEIKEFKQTKETKEIEGTKEDFENEKNFEKNYENDFENEKNSEKDEFNDDFIVDILSTTEEGTIKKFTTYQIQTKNKGKVFFCSHRFSEFKKLHLDLIKIIPNLGELPSSSLTKFSTSPEVVNERKLCLEKYLQGIMQIQELQGYRPVVEFLNLHHPAE